MKNRSNKPLRLRKLRRLLRHLILLDFEMAYTGAFSPGNWRAFAKEHKHRKRELYKELRSVEKDMDDLITTLRTLVD